MDSLQNGLATAHYFCVLSDGSTDSSVIEEELVYLLFLKSGKPLLKFLPIEPANNANAEGIIERIKTAFERIGILDFQKRIMGLNVEGASVNTGVEKSVPKPSKSYGTRWIDHKLTSMKIMLENYGAYISHVESLSQTDF